MDHPLQAPRGVGFRGGRRDGAGGTGAAGKVMTARQLEEAAIRSAGRRPLAPVLTLHGFCSGLPAWHIPRGRRGRVADPTLTFMVEAETRRVRRQGVLEGRSDAQHK